MTVSAGVGGGGLGGVVVGGAASGGSVVTLGGSSVTLPFTGAPELMVMLAVAFVLLVAGVLFTGLAKRLPDSSTTATS